jgi:hypothetical protein
MCAVQVNLWQKAAECERARGTTTDVRGRELLAYLETLWIALANKSPFLTSDELAGEMETMNQFQTDMLADLNLAAPGVRAEPGKWRKARRQHPHLDATH